MVFFNTMIELALISMALSIFNRGLQAKFGNKDQVKEHQEKMKKSQAQVKELMNKEDDVSKKKREELEKEMLESMNVVMKGTMKVMMVSLIVILPVFALMGMVYAETIVDLPVPVPWIGSQLDFFNVFSWIELYNQTSWIGWYVLISLLFSLIILNPLIKIYEKMKKKDEKGILESDMSYKKKMEGMK